MCRDDTNSACKWIENDHVCTPQFKPKPQRLQPHVLACSKAGHTDAKISPPAMAMKTFNFSHKPRQSPTAVASSKAGMVDSSKVGCLVWTVPCRVSCFADTDVQIRKCCNLWHLQVQGASSMRPIDRRATENKCNSRPVAVTVLANLFIKCVKIQTSKCNAGIRGLA